MTSDDLSTILVVEDDDATRTFLADNLTADGYDLLVADCASIGLSLIERKFPDLALVDVGLPDGSGFDLLRRVRSADGVASRINPDMPLIVISGRATELDRMRGFDRGADDYVCKPFSYPELRHLFQVLTRERFQVLDIARCWRFEPFWSCGWPGWGRQRRARSA